MAELMPAPRWALVSGWLLLASLVVLSLVPLPAAPGDVPHSDKWLHLLTYGCLGYWFFHLYARHQLIVMTGLCALGLALEGLQSFSPYRSTELADALMNALGVITAWLVFSQLGWRLKLSRGREKHHG